MTIDQCRLEGTLWGCDGQQGVAVLMRYTPRLLTLTPAPNLADTEKWYADCVKKI